VPHTNIEDFRDVIRDGERCDRAVAIISNVGSLRWPSPEFLKLRREFATYSEVDLFGRRDAWATYRRHIFAKRGAPTNYKGELPGYWTDERRFSLLSKYKAAICLENAQEPFYFTEKFVGAVQSGCIPIYAAHPTVKETFLGGARWIDPADFGYSAAETIKFALNQDRLEFAEQNRHWFFKAALNQTSAPAVFQRIGGILLLQRPQLG
jgi:hypothetical protein